MYITFDFTDLIFIQEGTNLPVSEDTVSIDGTKQLSIVLPSETLPSRLKTILVVGHPVPFLWVFGEPFF